MTLAEKLAAIYAAKLDIRVAIKAKGIVIFPDTPFADYAGKILLIQGGGESGGNNGAVVSIKSFADNFTIGFILPQSINAAEIAALIAEFTGVDSLAVAYPPVAGSVIAEFVKPNNIAPPIEDASVVYTMFAFAESLGPSAAFRYDYDADWVEFTPNGAYVRDRTLTTGGAVEGMTNNGAYFAAPLPNRQRYGGIIKLQAKIEVNANG